MSPLASAVLACLIVFDAAVLAWTAATLWDRLRDLFAPQPGTRVKGRRELQVPRGRLDDLFPEPADGDEPDYDPPERQAILSARVQGVWLPLTGTVPAPPVTWSRPRLCAMRNIRLAVTA